MSLNRREFLVLSASACAGCAGVRTGGDSSPSPIDSSATSSASIDAGSIAQFSADGVYDHFASQGFFIIRNGQKLIALSSLCTHRRYRLQVSADHSFYCKAHGSCFDQTGHVTEGPASRDLPELPTSVNSSGHLLVIVSG